jgi:signal transduction histidine kinase
MTTNHQESDWKKIVKDIFTAEDFSEILNKTRGCCNILPISSIDFFLYSEDLESFFFPPATTGMPDENIRNLLTESFTITNVDSENFQNFMQKKKDDFEKNIINKTGEIALIIPAAGSERFFGFILWVFRTPEGLEKSADAAKTLSSICEICFENYYQKLEIEKLTLENNLLRKNLSKCENLKILGEMIGGITHDMNNILTGVSGFAQLIEMTCTDEETVDSAREIIKASTSGKDIINFISKTKKINLEDVCKTIDISEKIRETAKNFTPFLRNFHPDITSDNFFKVKSAGVFNIEIQTTLLEQFFLNIFAGMIENGASGININIQEINNSIQIEISCTDEQCRTITATQTEKDLSDGLIINFLAEHLDFDLCCQHHSFLVNIVPKDSQKKLQITPEVYTQKILVYEPDKHVYEMFKTFFKTVNADVELINNIEKLNSLNPDIFYGYDKVIIDSTALTYLKSIDLKTQKPQIILISAWGKYLDKEAIKNIQPDEVLLKPFTFRRLNQILR